MYLQVDAQEEVGSVQPQVEQAFLDFSLFNTMVKMVAFDPFADQVWFEYYIVILYVRFF